jgi:hypothetical protein
MVVPEPADAPVIPPVMVPTVHVNVLAVLAVSGRFVFVPLQTDAELGVVTTGVGFTVTVILVAAPTHEPTVAVGVTRYTTVPAVELLGSDKVWAIVLPEPALEPNIPPLTLNIDQLNVLATLAVRTILVVVPLQIDVEFGVVKLGDGLTVTVIAVAAPAQEPSVAVGVTLYTIVLATVLL